MARKRKRRSGRASGPPPFMLDGVIYDWDSGQPLRQQDTYSGEIVLLSDDREPWLMETWIDQDYGERAWRALRPYRSNPGSSRKNPGPKMPKRANNPRRKRKKTGWALVKSSGMDDRVVSVHKTKEAAEDAMRKMGYEPSSMFQGGYRVVDATKSGGWEIIEVFGSKTIRPRRNNPAVSPSTPTESELARKLKF